MLWFTIFLGVVCVILLVMLSVKDNKNTALVAENSLMKGRMEALQEKSVQAEPVVMNDPLSPDGIEEAVRHMGYVPDKSENWVRFMVAGEPYYVETERLPSVFLIRQFSVDTKEWEMDLLKHAAHLMSDELIMVKATFDEDEQGTGLRFFVAALDANNASFRENLPKYLSIIEDGRRKMHEIYEQLVKEKRDAAMTINPFLPAGPQENKVMS